MGLLEVGGKVYQDSGHGPGRCMVKFRCPECGGETVLNAYFGQPFHHGQCWGVPMEPITVVRDTPAYDMSQGIPNGKTH